MGHPSAGRIRHRARLALALLALLAAAIAAFLSPPLVLPALIIVASLLLWDRAALSAELRGLAAMVAAAEPDAKLEVAEGAWGELCHALNRLLQQRRTEIQLRHMLPALPLAGAIRLADASLPPEGLPCTVVILAMSAPAGASDPLAHLREAAYAALHQAQLHDALLTRWGEGMLLIFGALGTQNPTGALRGAYQSARALASTWAGAPPALRPRLTLTGGPGRAVILPGLGLTVVGTPVEQALALQSLATGTQLVCNEDAYLGLRRLGVVPAHPAARLPGAPGRSPAFTLPL